MELSWNITSSSETISEETEYENPKLYKILEHYRNFSGQTCLINTSFNLHYEPIVNTCFDALKSFKSMKLKYMQCENLLVKSWKI